MKQHNTPENQPDIETKETVLENQSHPEKPEPPHEEPFAGPICNCQHIFHKNKWWVILLIFLAGMGFNALIHGAFGGCKHHQMPMHHISAIPTVDGAGTMVIINTDGTNATQPMPACNCKKHSPSTHCANHSRFNQPKQPRTGESHSAVMPQQIIQENP